MNEPRVVISGQLRRGWTKYYGSIDATKAGVRISGCMSGPMVINKEDIVAFHPFYLPFMAGISVIHRRSDLPATISVQRFALNPSQVIKELQALGLGLPPDVLTAEIVDLPPKRQG